MFKRVKKENPDVYIRLNEYNKKMHNKKVKRCIFVTLVFIVCFISMIEKGILHIKFIDDYNAAKEKKIINKIENAKSVYDLLPYLENINCAALDKDEPRYIEAKNYKKYNNLFELFTREEEYTIVTIGNDKYAVFVYHNKRHIGKVTKIKSAEKEYKNGKLEVIFRNEMVQIFDEKMGWCGGNAGCIIKLDEDINELVVEGISYKKYEGGLYKARNLHGYIGSDLEVVVPFEYRSFQYEIKPDFGMGENLDSYAKLYETYNESENPYKYKTGYPGSYVRVIKGDKEGLLDPNLNMIFEPEYSKIYFQPHDCFLVEKYDEGTKENKQFILNSDKKILYEHQGGTLGQCFFLKGKNLMFIYYVMKLENGKEEQRVELLDGKFNTIIGAEYNYIIQMDYPYMKDDGKVGAFKVIQGDKSAFFTVEGEQITPFTVE